MKNILFGKGRSMKTNKILFCQVLAFIISIVLLNGCTNNELTTCQQENLELKNTIEAQKAKITEHEANAKTTLTFLQITAAEIQKCQKQVEQFKKEKELAAKRKKISPKRAEALKKGLEELKALREIKAKRMMEEQAKAQEKQSKQ
jgi:hypothetical protein